MSMVRAALRAAGRAQRPSARSIVQAKRQQLRAATGAVATRTTAFR